MAEQHVDEIRTVGIVGCGTMGSGIAELIARHGHPVRFVEQTDDAVEAGLRRIHGSLDRQVRRDRLTSDERATIAARIDGSTDWSTLASCDLIIEAVPEVLELKQAAFRQIDSHAGPNAIIATNTSSLPVMDIAVHSRRPNRVLGFHFFNPAPVMRLIELVRTVVTDKAVVDVARAFAESIGKVPVVVGDRRGFIANQLLFPYLNQAVWMVEGGYATKEDVDVAMRLGAGLPMGPIALTDLVGIDTFVGIMDAIHAEVRDTRFAPRPILGHLAAAGFTGRKAGRGFYTYEVPGSSQATDTDDRLEPDLATIGGWTTVGVLGTGPMADGVVEAAALADFDVVVRDRSRDRAERVAANVARSLQRGVDKGAITIAQMDAAIGRIRTTYDLNDLADCQLVIEAGGQDADSTTEALRTVAPLLREDAVLSTSSSSTPVIDAAMATGRPDRVVGLHFFSPAAVMQLVEIVETVRTAPTVVEQARAFVEQIGKVGVLCGDRAGFIVNTLLFPYLNDAVKMLESHYATAEQIDTAMKLGCGYPLGPFELMDAVGLDLTLSILERLEAEYRQPSYVPAPLLRNMVEAGFLGKKAGRGFYVYE